MKIGRVTLSDRASGGIYEDKSGPEIERVLRGQFDEPVDFECVLLPDEEKQIVAALKHLCATGCTLVVTTGGTGPGARDVTPEATRAVCERLVEGIAEQMRLQGTRTTRFAALSRALCGVRGTSLILNLPGSPAGAVESLDAVIDLVPHALELIGGKTGH